MLRAAATSDLPMPSMKLTSDKIITGDMMCTIPI
ncbi:hypothetical protein ACVIHH_008456 [Bradyrhizobium sp. USDA 4518]